MQNKILDNIEKTCSQFRDTDFQIDFAVYGLYRDHPSVWELGLSHHELIISVNNLEKRLNSKNDTAGAQGLVFR